MFVVFPYNILYRNDKTTIGVDFLSCQTFTSFDCSFDLWRVNNKWIHNIFHHYCFQIWRKKTHFLPSRALSRNGQLAVTAFLKPSSRTVCCAGHLRAEQASKSILQIIMLKKKPSAVRVIRYVMSSFIYQVPGLPLELNPSVEVAQGSLTPQSCSSDSHLMPFCKSSKYAVSAIWLFSKSTARS